MSAETVEQLRNEVAELRELVNNGGQDVGGAGGTECGSDVDVGVFKIIDRVNIENNAVSQDRKDLADKLWEEFTLNTSFEHTVYWFGLYIYNYFTDGRAMPDRHRGRGRGGRGRGRGALFASHGQRGRRYSPYQ